MKRYTYEAFISYKQQHDRGIAKSLQRKIEHYHIPSGLQKGVEKKKLKVFRDEDELRATSSLTAEIRNALKKSKFLIVICSPEAKTAPWIINEIEIFIKTHGNSDKNIITVIARGEREDAIPDILKKKNEKGQNEILSADYRKKRGRKNKLAFIIAKLIDCEYDELIQRRKIYERKRLIASIFVFGAVLATFVIIYNKILCEQSKNLAFLSESAYDNYNTEEAIEKALEAIQKKKIGIPIPEAKRALVTAIDAYKFEDDEMEIIRNIKPHVSIKEYAVYEKGDGTYISVLGEDTNIQVYNIKTGERVIYAEPLPGNHGPNDSVHIIMCEENQLLCLCSNCITSFDLDKKTLSWLKYLEIDTSLQYINLSYNSDSIAVGLKGGKIIILDKKSGKQTDLIDIDRALIKTKDKKEMHAKISSNGRYLICYNQLCAYLYDRNKMEFYVISNDINSEYEKIDGHIMGDFCILSYTEKDDIYMLCYDMKRKKNIFKKQMENENEPSENELSEDEHSYIPWFISLENVTINGKKTNIIVSIIGNSMILIDGQSGKIISEIQFANCIQGAFLQKRDSSHSSIHDYSILSLGCDEDILTVIFENGECMDYSLQDKNISESYKTFEDGIVHPEKTNNYFFISCKDKLREAKKDNARYGKSFNIKTHRSELFANNILVYGKRQINTDWKKITDDYDYKSEVYPYKNGFLIFQPKNCIYYDIKKEEVVWENQHINYITDYEIEMVYSDEGFWTQNNKVSYEYLGIESSEQRIMIGSLEEDFSYKIQFLNGENGEVSKIDNLNIESFNDTQYKIKTVSDFKKIDGKIFFSVKLENGYGLIISYDLESKEYHSEEIKLKKASALIKILAVSHNGQHVFLCEKSETTQYLDTCYQSTILDMNNGKLYQLELDDDTKKHIILTPNPCWSDNDQYMAIRSDDGIYVFSKTGNYKHFFKTENYIFAGFCFFKNRLYVVAEENGIPILFRYSVRLGCLLGRSELNGRSGFCGNTFDIKCIKSFDSEVIMILKPSDSFQGLYFGFRLSGPFYNAWIIDQPTGKSIAFIRDGVAYNRNIDCVFASKGIVKRYTTKELVRKASHMK